ncbi:MAG: phage head closure protein [Rhizobiales bacterium]|nr:phage head closure protein [Hyphomicrobiales bacterium]
MSRIGAMRARVTLQAATRESDGAGGSNLGWSDVATLWAAVTPRKGQERLIGERPEARQTWEVVMRWRNDVTSAHRLLWQSRVLTIESVVDPDGRKRWLRIEAEEGRHEP